MAMLPEMQTPAKRYGLIGLSDFEALDASIRRNSPAHACE